jgi:L-2-hydroxyglutarate oxidase
MFDYAIIGGGIVGLATARAVIAAEPAARIVLIEKEPGLTLHQSGHNSGVIHAGIYYAPGSFKAELCRAGMRATKDYCAQNGVPFDECGKLIVATNAIKRARLVTLAERAAANGIAVEPISGDRLREIEPNIVGEAALLVRATAIVDYRQVGAAMAAGLLAAGVEIHLSRPATAIRELADRVEIDTPQGAVRARKLVACAGLQSDRIARLAGLQPRQRIVPFRGEYYVLAPERNQVVRHLIYPVPDPALPFLGVHLTRMIDGSVTVGPNAVLGLAREKYGRAAFNLRDAAATLAFPGFWRVAASNWRSGIDEFRGSLSRRHYLSLCRKYCPSLGLADLAGYRAGIRAQAIDSDGTLVHDFLFAQTDRMLHVINAPSPAATSAIPIGAMIAGRLRSQ